MSTEDLVRRREALLGPGNPLFYEEDPLHIVRGEGVWLYDADGRKYLDCYNNVPSVGHCHPHVVEALCKQAGQLNTHTRYLHENILNYAERLLDKFDPSLNRLMLACTGSEANEQAMRMARVCTGGSGFICTNASYHGNTTLVSQMSAIFEPVEGYSEHTRIVPWPDSYRTLDGLEGEALARAYAEQVKQAIVSFAASDIKLAGMLVCPIFANEGLTTIAKEYLQLAVKYVRDAGGVFIADEVQSGFGRSGHWWGHEPAGIVPDIITLGKPMGAGHPISGVVARHELFDQYREEVMYFNTFGGNPVTCAVGLAVLDVLEKDDLIGNAATVGAYVLEGFKKIQDKHDIIGDVRGSGLFFGVDMVLDRKKKAPAPKETKVLVNNMREAGVIMGKIGEHDNVLKLRPPMPFSKDHADFLLETLDQQLAAL